MKKSLIVSGLFLTFFSLYSSPVKAEEASLYLNEDIEVLSELNEDDSYSLIMNYSDQSMVLSPVTYAEYLNEEFLVLEEVNMIIYIEYINPEIQELRIFDYKNEQALSIQFLHDVIGIEDSGHHDPYGFYDLKESQSGDYFSILGSNMMARAHLFIFDVEKIRNGNTLEDSYYSPEFDQVSDTDWIEGDILVFKNGLNHPINESPLTKDIIELDVEQKATEKVGTYPPSSFPDLSESDEDYAEVLRAMQEGWIQGDDDTGEVRLDDPINRAEFSKVAILALKIEEEGQPNQDQSICPDVPWGQWYSGVFYVAKKRGAIQGYPQEGVPTEQWLCKPDQTINKVEALKVALELNRWSDNSIDENLFENQYDDTNLPSEWFWPYTGVSNTFNLIRSANGNLYPAEPITRREVIYLMNHMRDQQHEWLGHG